MGKQVSIVTLIMFLTVQTNSFYVILEYLLAFSSILLPLAITLIFGPKMNRRRMIYLVVGFAAAVVVGEIMLAIDIKSRFSDPAGYFAIIAFTMSAAFAEELLRYPGVLIAQITGKRFGNKEIEVSEEELKLTSTWTKINDGHGLGIYFGLAWGYYETIAYYIQPLIENYIAGEDLIFMDELSGIVFRITGIMAHIALTYLSMIITVNRGFYRFAIILHVGTNFITASFTFLSINLSAETLFVLFTRFALIVIIVYILRPKARYYTPALLLLIVVLLFLLFILLGTVIFLFGQLLNVNIFEV